MKETFIESLHGLTAVEATERCAAMGYTVQICEPDSMGVSHSFKHNEVMLFVDKGLVYRGEGNIILFDSKRSPADKIKDFGPDIRESIKKDLKLMSSNELEVELEKGFQAIHELKDFLKLDENFLKELQGVALE